MMAVFLVAPDTHRLVGLLLLRERVELHNEGSLFERKRFNQVGFAVQLLLGVVLIFTFGKQSWKQRSEYCFHIQQECILPRSRLTMGCGRWMST